MQIAILGRGVVGGGIVKLVEEAETPLLRKIKIKKSLIRDQKDFLSGFHIFLKQIILKRERSGNFSGLRVHRGGRTGPQLC